LTKSNKAGKKGIKKKSKESKTKTEQKANKNPEKA
jgi:hypothetical protein